MCCGCGSCAQSCPKHCISMLPDSEGFMYPYVDSEACVDCGLCEAVCPELHPFVKRVPRKTLAAINTNIHVREYSSSGGVFSALAENVIAGGGVVFGAQYNDNWQVSIECSETLDGLALFRGSKYVQARNIHSYSTCEKILKSGRKVLYCGTPCQISGLRRFLHDKEYPNLLLVDFVCHGVPSPKVWSKYLDELAVTFGVDKPSSNEKTLNKLTSISMRSKPEGWKNYHFAISYTKSGKSLSVSNVFRNNFFMKAFLNNMTLRPSCYHCIAKNCSSGSDITMADYWGIQNVLPQMDDDNGTSLVLVHSSKGQQAIDHCHCLQMVETSFENAYQSNPSIIKDPKPWSRRSEFFAMLDETDSVIELMEKCMTPTFSDRLLHIASKIVRIPVGKARKIIRHFVQNNDK